MSDRREEIFIKHHDVGTDACGDRIEFLGKEDSFMAMDEYMKELCLDLISWMLNHGLFASRIVGGEKLLYYRGEYITPDQLFENFL